MENEFGLLSTCVFTVAVNKAALKNDYIYYFHALVTLRSQLFVEHVAISLNDSYF